MFGWLDLAALSVAICTLGANLLNSLYMFYYIKVFLLVYKIDEDWFKSVQSTLIVIHLINEPLFGYVQDYAFLWLRNRRRTILIAGPILAVVYLFPWFNWYDPEEASAWVPGLHFVLALLTWNIAYPFVNTTIRGYFFEVSTDESHRVKIVRYNEVANVLATTALMPVDKWSYSLRDYANFQYSSIIVAIFACLCFVLAGFMRLSPSTNHKIARSVSEYSRLSSASNKTQQADRSSKKFSTGSQLSFSTSEHFWPTTADEYRLSSFKMAFTVCKEVLSSKKFWLIAGANFSLWFRNQSASSFLAIFTEILVSPDILPTGSYELATFYTLCLMLPRLTLVISTPLAQKFGTDKLIMTMFVLTWINSAMAIIGGVFISYNMAIGFLLVESILFRFQTMFMVIISGFIEEDTIEHNRRLPASTLIFTLQSSAVKSTISLAPIIVAALLNLSGYKEFETSHRDTPESFKTSVTLIAFGLPAINATFGFVLFFFYKKISSKDKMFRESSKVNDQFASEYEQIPS